MAGLETRELGVSDALSIQRLWERTHILSPEILAGPWSLEGIEKVLTTGGSLGVWNGEALIAFVFLEKSREKIEIYHLVVDEDWRRQGIMKGLLEEIIRLREGRLVWLEVSEANGAALTLYKLLGFKKTGRRPEYYRDGSAAFLMTLE